MNIKIKVIALTLAILNDILVMYLLNYLTPFHISNVCDNVKFLK